MHNHHEMLQGMLVIVVLSGQRHLHLIILLYKSSIS